MKKFLLSLCVAMLSCIAFAQRPPKMVYVLLKDGTQVKYLADDIDRISVKYSAVPAEETGLNFIYDEFSMTAGVTYDKTVGIYELDEVEIPSQVVYKGEVYDVISIRKDAFKYSESLTSIEIPESVTIIGDEAFVYCVNLTSIEIPSSVTKIGRSAFADCQNLKTARVPVGCELGNNAFPSTCEIEWYGGAVSTAIPVDQTGLKFMYDYTNKTASVTGVYNKEVTSVEIPSKVSYVNKEYDVTSIGASAFVNCTSLTSINIPNSVTSIGEAAFSGCAITSIEIPESVTTIGMTAFMNCTSLTSINIPNSVTTIGANAFSGCTNLTSIEIPSSVTSIGEDAFWNCERLTSINIPNSVTSIGEDAFKDCDNLKTARVPLGCELGNNAFPSTCVIEWYGDAETSIPADQTRLNFSYNATTMTASVTGVKDKGITSVGIPYVVFNDGKEYKVTSIGRDAFEDCFSLTSIGIPNSVTSIGINAFYRCTRLTSIEIPNSVTSIGNQAFKSCRNLKSIEIPNSVITIGSDAFDNCTSLTSIVVDKSNKVYDSRENCNAIIKTANNCLIKGCQNTVIPNSVTTIGYGAFDSCPNLVNIVIPRSVTEIERNAFMGCTSLKSARVPKGCTIYTSYPYSFPATCEIEWY